MNAELFIEIRCEELPARFVKPALGGLVRGVQGLLRGVEHGELRTWATPRRIALAISNVADGKPVEEKLVTGPPERSAFKDGVPTRAAQGFARGKGVAVEDLQIVDGPKGRVIAARVRSGGERTADLVAAGLDKVVMGIHFPKTMRWGSRKTGWARPIHGVVALLGDALIDTRVADIPASRQTLGHRLSPGPITVSDAQSWVDGLRAHHVEPDLAARRERILGDLRAAAQALGASVEEHLDLVDEIVQITEWPVVVTATFDEELLHLPPRLLVEAMKVHQRTFPLYRDGELTRHYLVVTNHPLATDPEVAGIIAEGNTRVIAARFDDARFFYAEDKKQRLEEHGAALTEMQWIRGGGTMADKASRIGTLAGHLAPRLGADPALARHAGELSKADLATQMVGEFPELQGHVGRLLAAFQGEEPHVALAIEEHYLPRFAGDALPTTAEGRAVALADRVDTLTGCFHHGLKPKGSADPLGLRRAANGLCLLVLDAGLRGDLSQVLAVGSFPAQEDLATFILARFRAQQLEGHPTDVVDAVLATESRDLVALAARIDAMTALAESPEYGPLKTTFKRVFGLTKDHASAAFDADALVEPSERALAQALAQASAQAATLAEQLDYGAVLRVLSGLKPQVDQLFDDVFVMDDDLDVRRNRLGLLRAVADAFRQVADLTVLSA